MGGGQSREKAIQRWLTQPKDLTVLTSTRGGLNSHLSIGLFRLAIAVILILLFLFNCSRINLLALKNF